MKLDLALLLLRVSFGVSLLLAHGLDKLLSFSEKAATFPDPLGLGSEFTMALAIFAEFFCALAIAFGLFTRLATIPIIVTMASAFLFVHTHDPFIKKELPFLLAMAFTSIGLAGAGRWSLDAIIWRKNRNLGR